MKVRPLRKLDGPEVGRQMELNFAQELGVRGWDPQHFLQVFQGAFRFPANLFLGFLKLAGQAPVYLLGVEEDGKLVGTTMVFMQRTHGYFASVMSDPAMRRRGIASLVLDAAEDRCRRRHRRWVVLDVIATNEPAVALYRKRGYRPLREQQWVMTPLAGRTFARPSASAGVRPMENDDLDALLELYRDQQPPPVREVLAPEKALISPPAYLESILAATSAAWCTGPVGAPRTYVRATFTTPKEAGNLSAPVFRAGAPPEEKAAVIDTALAWLAAQGTPRAVSEVPTYLTEALTALHERGFADLWKMNTLLLTLDDPRPAA